MASFPLRSIQSRLREEGLDGWLFTWFQGNDPIAEKILGLDGQLLTRRVFYFVPARGAPQKLVHRIEPEALDHLPGPRLTYLSWKELEGGLARILRGAQRVAMQYSPRNRVPYISRVDAGTVEWVRSLGSRIVSSGDLVQAFEAVLTPSQARQHEQTAALLRRFVFDAFGLIRRRLSRGQTVDERRVQQFLVASYRRHGLVSNSDPIVAANENSGRPHYAPSKNRFRRIRKGDWVLLDIWAKPGGPEAVYADITWCGFAGPTVPDKFERIFQVVRRARDQALDRVRRAFESGSGVLHGWQVDRAARTAIERHGYGRYFLHRTGHSIGREDHGNGAHMDGLETRDTRRLLPGTLFSIEPGIYLKDFGARSEINVFLDGRRARVSGRPIQERVIPILGWRAGGMEG